MKSTRCVSISSQGQAGKGSSYNPSISENGNYIVFESNSDNLVLHDNNEFVDIFVHDIASGTTERVSVNDLGVEENSTNWQPDISGNGDFIVYSSYATNLDLRDNSSDADVFLYDRLNRTTPSIIRSGQGGNGNSWYPAINYSGDYVVYDDQSGTGIICLHQ